MRWKLGLFFLLFAALFLMGMGKLDQTEKPGEIPLPDKEIAVNLTDNEGLTLNVSQFSLNGQTSLTGKLGAGRLTMPLSQIRVIALSNGPKGLSAKIDLTDRSQISLYLDKGILASGRIKAGTYQISLEHLKKIEILTVSEMKKP